MINLLVELIVLCLIGGVVYWIVMAIVAAMALPPPFGKVIQVAMLLIFLLAILGLFLGGGYLPHTGRWSSP